MSTVYFCFWNNSLCPPLCRRVIEPWSFCTKMVPSSRQESVEMLWLTGLQLLAELNGPLRTWPSVLATVVSSVPTNDSAGFFIWYLRRIHQINHSDLTASYIGCSCSTALITCYKVNQRMFAVIGCNQNHTKRLLSGVFFFS